MNIVQNPSIQAAFYSDGKNILVKICNGFCCHPVDIFRVV